MSSINEEAEPTDNPFLHQEAENVELSRRERYRKLVDAFVLAPLKILWDDWRGRAGLLILGIYVFMGTIGVHITRAPDPNQADRYIPPFSDGWISLGQITVEELGGLTLPWVALETPLGTDALGRDLLSMLVHATPAMLEMILVGALFTTILATIVGTISGYVGGLTDTVLMSISDVLMTIPSLPLVMVVVVILQPEQPWLVGILLSVNAWASLARAIRSEVLSLREVSYVEASKTMGLSTRWILRRDLLPNLMSYIAIRFVSSARRIIFGSVGLYFLGILPFDALNWGVMLNEAYRTGGGLLRLETFYWILEPMIVIIGLSLGFIFLAQGLDRVFNPRIRARHMKTQDDADEQLVEDQDEPAIMMEGQ